MRPSPNEVTLRVSHPTFEVGIEAASDALFDCMLKFQSRTVVMLYSKTAGVCVYVWPQALPAGAYSGSITVSALGEPRSKATLHFQIAPGAIAQLPHTSLFTLHTLGLINFAREHEGLPLLSFDGGLQAAAQAHAAYMNQNVDPYIHGASWATEPDHTAGGFTGANPAERAAAFGAIAPGGVSELYSDRSPEGTILGIMGSLFERLAVLDPRTLNLGAGGHSFFNSVFDFGVDNGTPAAPLEWEFPWNGATDVQTSYAGDTPDPLARFPGTLTADPEAGYPVSITFNPLMVRTVHLDEATLSMDGKQVPLYLFDGRAFTGKDPYPSGSVRTTVALFSRSRLSYSTTYTAHVSGTLIMRNGSAKPFDDTWSFTTEPAVQVRSAWQDGDYLFVVGRGLLGAEISVAPASPGTVAPPLQTVYRDPYVAAFKVQPGEHVNLIDAGTYWSAQVTPIPVTWPPFRDMASSVSSLVSVNLGWARSIVIARPGSAFRPNAMITDAQALAMIYDSLGSPAVPSGKSGTAIGIPAWAQKAISWALADGVLESTDGFSPDGKATRAQLITWLMRAYRVPPSSASPRFADAKRIAPQFSGYVASAQDLGLATGFPDGTFRPNSLVTRGTFMNWLVNIAMPSPPEMF